MGSARLIVARPEDPDHPLPFETSCAATLDRSIVDPSQIAREKFGEISRLAVVSRYRQRKGESNKPVSLTADDFAAREGQSRFPFIPVALYFGMAAMARQLGLDYAFVLTEPRLAEHFARIGFPIQVVGGAVEHRGLRAPALLRGAEFEASLRPMIRPLYELVEQVVADSFRTCLGLHEESNPATGTARTESGSIVQRLLSQR